MTEVELVRGAAGPGLRLSYHGVVTTPRCDLLRGTVRDAVNDGATRGFHCREQS